MKNWYRAKACSRDDCDESFHTKLAREYHFLRVHING